MQLFPARITTPLYAGDGNQYRADNEKSSRSPEVFPAKEGYQRARASCPDYSSAQIFLRLNECQRKHGRTSNTRNIFRNLADLFARLTKRPYAMSEKGKKR